MRLIVHVNPLEAPFPGYSERPFHQPSPDAPPLIFGVDAGIEQKSVNPTVPAELDEANQANQPLILVSTDVSQGLSQLPREVNILVPCLGRGKQSVQILIADRRVGLQANLHIHRT